MNENTVINEVTENVVKETAKQSHWGIGETVLATLAVLGAVKAAEIGVAAGKCVYNGINGFFKKGEQTAPEAIDLTEAKEVQDEEPGK